VPEGEMRTKQVLRAYKRFKKTFKDKEESKIDSKRIT